MKEKSAKRMELSKASRESLVVDLILCGALRETFSASAYAINAYLAVGSTTAEAALKQLPDPRRFETMPTLKDLAKATGVAAALPASPAAKKQRVD